MVLMSDNLTMKTDCRDCRRKEKGKHTGLKEIATVDVSRRVAGKCLHTVEGNRSASVWAVSLSRKYSRLICARAKQNIT